VIVVEQIPRTVVFTPPARLLSLNDRTHRYTTARLIRAWRRATATAAAEQIDHQLGPCIVQIALPVADRRQRDPHNYFATVKPIVDGLVDAGLWPNDTPTWVTTVEPTLIPPTSRAARAFATVTVTLTPRGEQR
jgi:crossover junction endodeoxyribonuclease RusA